MSNARRHALTRTAATAGAVALSVFAATGTANALTADGNPTPEWLIFLLPAIAALIEAVAQFIKARAQRPQAKTRAAR